MNKPRIIAGSVAVLLLLLGGAWAMGMFHRTDPAVAELQQMRDQMRNASATDRQQLFDQFRQKMDGLSDAQRREFRDSSRGQFQQGMTRRMKEFESMPPAEQQKQLDQIIDRMVQRQKERAQNPNAPGAGTGGQTASNQGGRGGNGGGGGRQNMTDSQREQARKERLDNSNPLERAQRDKFRQMLGDRMKQRGITPPPGGGGGPGWGRG